MADPGKADRSTLRRIKRLLRNSDPLIFGQRIKNIRESQGISIRALAEKAEVSKTSLVRVESGRPVQALTFLKICSALGMHVDRLQADNPPAETLPAVHKHTDDRWFDLEDFGAGPLADRPLGPQEREKLGIGAQMLMLKTRPTHGRMISGIIELYKRTKPRSHPGEEIVYVLSGIADIRVGTRRYVLQSGECIGFWCSEEHSYGPLEEGETPVKLFCVRCDI